MNAGQAPAESAEDVRTAPPDRVPSVSSPFGDSALAGASLPAGASEPDLLDGERHVSAARSQSTTSALRRVEYAAKNRALMSRLAEHTPPPNGGGEGIKRTRSVRLGLACSLLAVGAFVAPKRMMVVGLWHTHSPVACSFAAARCAMTCLQQV